MKRRSTPNCYRVRCPFRASHATSEAHPPKWCVHHASHKHVDVRWVRCALCRRKGARCDAHRTLLPPRPRGGDARFLTWKIRDAPGIVGAVLAYPVPGQAENIGLVYYGGAKRLGVCARRPLPAGTTVGYFSGYLVNRDHFDGEIRSYAIMLDDAVPVGLADGTWVHRPLDIDPAFPERGMGDEVDGQFAGCIAAYVNEPNRGHRPNAMFEHVRVTGEQGESLSLPGVFLARDVAAGEEITVKYGATYRSARTW